MRKLYLFITFLMIFITLQAQNINVLPGDFYRDSKDLTARTQVVKNDNNKNCALLKIITTEKGFTFEPDALGICKEVEYKTSEIWVWLAPGSRRITIKHPQLGQLRDYMYPEAIEASKVYVMKLTTAKINTIVEEVNTSNYVALTVNPAEASVKIDGQLVAIEDGQFQGRFPMGKHDYEVSCDMYHAENGTFTIVPDKTTYLQVNLKPNYGYLKVNSSPEEGALVYVNNRKVGETPYTSDKMLSGTYTVQVVKAMYKEANRQVVIEDGKKLEVQLNMPPNFAEPVISCVDADAEIWVNDEYLGKGSWTGRLSAGPYNVEVKKDRCRTVSRQLELKTGDKPTIDFPAPEPICGKLDVTTKPFGAEIFLDGKKIGKTPSLIDKVQIGEHSLELKKEGYVSISRKVQIEEGKTMEVNENLNTGVEVKIHTTPYSAAKVYVDGEIVGPTPISFLLSIGQHNLSIIPYGSGQVITDEIEVQDGGQTEWWYDVSNNSVPVTQVRMNKMDGKLELSYYIKDMASVSMKFKPKGQAKFTVPNPKNVKGDIGSEVFPGKRKIVFDVEKELSIDSAINNCDISIKATKQKMGFFFTANVAYATNPQLSFGLTLGAMKRWGWYVDLMSNFCFDGLDNTFQENEFYELTGKTNTSRHSLMLGAVYRICRPLSVKLGAGVGYRARNFEARNVMLSSTYTTLVDPQTKLFGLNAEAGVMFHIKRLVLTASVTTINFKYVEFKAGVGMYFPNLVRY